MTKLLGLGALLALLLVSSADAQVKVRYTTSAARGALGTGACLTITTRCTNTYAISLSNAGDTVSLEGNTSLNPFVYADAASVIKPLARSGVAGAPILVKCEVPGGCLIDGQFARIPVDVAQGSNYWRIEDIGVRNGTSRLVRNKGNFNEFRRIVGWDILFAGANGAGMFFCDTPSIGTVFEDVAGFGIGTWVFSHSQDKAGGCTFRRVWGRFEGTSNSNNGGTAFGGLFYKALSTTCENCIGEYFPNTGLTSYPINGNPTSGCPGGLCTDGAPPVPNGPINQNRWFDHPQQSAPCDPAQAGGNVTACNMDGFVGGSLFYVRQGTNMTRMIVGSADSGGALMFAGPGRVGGQMTFKDVLWFVQPTNAQFANMRGLNLNERLLSTDMFLTNVTTVSGSANIIDTVDSSGNGSSGVWVKTNVAELANMATMGVGQPSNPWTGTVGANLCHRYVDRVRTTVPLWPWPMNQRIIDATTIAGAYTGPCVGCVGTFPVRTAVNVTALVEGMLGTIPLQCRNDTPTQFPDAPGFVPPSLTMFD